MSTNAGLARKLQWLVLASAAVVVGLIVLYSDGVSRRILLASVEEHAQSLVQSTVNRIEVTLTAVTATAHGVAAVVEDQTGTDSHHLRLLERILESTPAIRSATIALDPGPDPSPAHRALQVRRGPQGLRYGALADYEYQPWFQLPKELGRAVWTEPYYHDLTQELMTTYSVPLHSGQHGDFVGVAVCDVSLQWLSELVASLRLLPQGYAFLLSPNGTFVVHPDARLVMNETIFSLAEAADDLRLRKVGQAMIRGRSDFVELVSQPLGGKVFLAYAPLASSGWSLGVVSPQAALFADVRALSRDLVAIGAAGFGLMLVAVVWISRSITRPLRRLSVSAAAIAAGLLDQPLETSTAGDEVGELTRSFEHMRTSLQTFIAELTRTTAAQERIQSELAIAKQIQMELLPPGEPAEKDPRYQLQAYLEPAQEVGGDFFDYFLLGPQTLCFLVGDVSGKGVPAALFMATAKTLIKAIAQTCADPGEMVSRVNDELARDNTLCMFATLFLGVIDLETGATGCVNAGHPPAVLLDPQAGPQLLDVDHQPLVGAMTGLAYRTNSFTLRPGQLLFLYTDGVTEAMNSSQQLFGTPRLLAMVAGLQPPTPQTMIAATRKTLAAFAPGQSLADDLTLMVLRYSGSEKPL